MHGESGGQSGHQPGRKTDAGRSPTEANNSNSALRIGDKVSLFALEAFGFLRGDGFVHDRLTVEPLDFKVSMLCDDE